MKERRKLERFSLQIPATIEVIDQGQRKAKVEVVTSNICAGGAYFQTTNPLPKGTQIKIDLLLTLQKLKELKVEYDQAYIKVTGTVLRTESQGMAVRFDEDYEIRPHK